MFTLIIVVSFAPLVFVTGLVIERFQSVYKTSVQAHLRVLVDKHADLIDDFLEEKRNNLIFLASIVEPESFNNATYLKTCLDALQAGYGSVFEDLSVINESGRQTAYAGPFPLLNAEYADTDWFKQAIRHTVYTSDVFTGYRGYPHFVVTVRRTTAETRFLVRATIRFETFSALIENLKIGSTGSAFIVNTAGRFQTQPDPQVVSKTGVLKNLSQQIQRAGPSVQIPDIIHELFDNTLCMTARIKQGAWLLVYLQDPSDAYDALIRVKKTSVVIFLLGGGCIILMACYLPTRLLLSPAENGDKT